MCDVTEIGSRALARSRMRHIGEPPGSAGRSFPGRKQVIRLPLRRPEIARNPGFRPTNPAIVDLAGKEDKHDEREEVALRDAGVPEPDAAANYRQTRKALGLAAQRGRNETGREPPRMRCADR